MASFRLFLIGWVIGPVMYMYSVLVAVYMYMYNPSTTIETFNTV